MRRAVEFGVGLSLALLLGGCAAPGPQLRDAAAPTTPVSVELADVPFYPQQDQQCGPAALATILEFAGVRVTPAELSPLVYLPGREGSLQVELKAAARRFDLMPYELEPEPAALLEQLASGRPVLVLQNLGLSSMPAWHFAVAVGFDVDREEVLLRSGRTERLVVSAHRFMRSWDRAGRWAVVVVAAGELPAGAQASRYMAAAAGLEAAGRVDAATRAYESAARAWPLESLPWLGLGNLAHANGEPGRAVEFYRQALARSPSDPVARNNLAQVLADGGCIESARVEAERALQEALGTPLEAIVASTVLQITARASTTACPPALD